MWWCLVLAGVSSLEQQQGWPGGMAVIAPPCLPTAALGQFQKESLLVGKEASARSSMSSAGIKRADLWGGLCACCLLRAWCSSSLEPLTPRGRVGRLESLCPSLPSPCAPGANEPQCWLENSRAPCPGRCCLLRGGLLSAHGALPHRHHIHTPRVLGSHCPPLPCSALRSAVCTRDTAWGAADGRARVY